MRRVSEIFTGFVIEVTDVQCASGHATHGTRFVKEMAQDSRAALGRFVEQDDSRLARGTRGEYLCGELVLLKLVLDLDRAGESVPQAKELSFAKLQALEGSQSRALRVSST